MRLSLVLLVSLARRSHGWFLRPPRNFNITCLQAPGVTVCTDSAFSALLCFTKNDVGAVKHKRCYGPALCCLLAGNRAYQRAGGTHFRGCYLNRVLLRRCRAVDMTAEQLGKMQDSFVYKALFPRLLSYADPALDALASTETYNALKDHLRPVHLVKSA